MKSSIIQDNLQTSKTFLECPASQKEDGKTVICDSLPMEIKNIRWQLYHMLPNEQAKNDYKKLMSFFESNQYTKNVKKANRFIHETCHYSFISNLNEDKQKYDTTLAPNVTISIAKVTKTVLKNSIKKAWGIEICIDGTSIPIYFGSKAATIIYISTLLKQKKGMKLNRKVFALPTPSKGSFVEKSQEVIWLEKVYKILYPCDVEDFISWYNKMKENSCHYISVGKSCSISKIKEHLSQFPNAISHCSIQRGGEQGNSYFYLDIPAECINIPHEFEELI